MKHPILHRSGIALAVAMLFSFGTAMAEPTTPDVEISASGVAGPRYGNSENPDGSDYNLPATGKYIKVTTNGEVTGGSSTGHIFGGFSDSGDAVGNKAHVDGDGVVSGHVVGGAGDNATNNFVVIEDSATVRENVMGGTSGGNTANNTVTITGGTVAGGAIGGAWGTVSENRVLIDTTDGGTVSLGFVRGGVSDLSADNNNVEIVGEDITVGESILGAAITDAGGNVTGNWVSIGNATGDTDVEVIGSIIGAKIGDALGDGDATGNYVNIWGNTTVDVDTGIIAGALVTKDGKVTDNWVIIEEGSEVTVDNGSILGASVAGNGTAENNLVSINGTVDLVDGGITGGHVDGAGTGNTAKGNQVIIGESAVVSLDTGPITGGFAREDGSATDNYVQISGTVSLGSGVHIIGGNVESGSATGNTVFIDGGDITMSTTGWIVGGYVSEESGSATGNTVFIDAKDSGMNLAGSIIGGFVAETDDSASLATGNTVTIVSDNASLVEVGGSILGGYIGDLVSSDDAATQFTGNTLNLGTLVDVGGTVANFENMNFFLTDAVLDALDGAAFVNADIFTIGGENLPDSKISINTAGGAPLTEAEFTLINTTDVLNIGDSANLKITGRHGATLQYDWQFEEDGKILNITGVTSSVRKETKALSQAYLAGLALTNQGAEIIADKGIAEAVKAARGNDNGSVGFAVVSGGHSKYDTGSNIKMDSFSLLAGLSHGWNVSQDNRVTAGIFFDYGKGSYDSNSIVDGDGKARYYGAGILGRMDRFVGGKDNAYVEGALRTGRVKNDHDSDLADAYGEKASYKAKSSYFGLQFAGGYVMNISEKNAVDLYGKYFWTRMGSEKVILSTNDDVSFNSLNSHRVRLGARFIHNLDNARSFYAGAAWEYEFDGKSKAKTYGYRIDSADIKGSTGIAELGMNFKPSGNTPLSLDVGLQGFFGKRDGVIGSLRMKYEF
ncbi:MAG: autotransporter outer membrane beta-barrel domain-containing protein [Betaproteobacteria bacterium]|nr:autotransporter outer membrane beta-barrel domain-containing protein [Betaproteobacteria bacterium]